MCSNTLSCSKNTIRRTFLAQFAKWINVILLKSKPILKKAIMALKVTLQETSQEVKDL